MSHKKILVLSISPLHRDPRVLRQLYWLKDRFEVTAAGLTDPNLPEISFYPIHMPGRSLLKKLIGLWFRITGQFDRWYWFPSYIQDTFNTLKTRRFDAIVCNDIDTLPLGLALKKSTGAKIIFDAHEFYPGHFDNSVYWRIVEKKLRTYLCLKYIPLCDEFITVSPGLVRGYQELVNRTPIVVTNAPSFSSLTAQPTDPNKIKLIHHGAANRARQLEKMVKMANSLDERFQFYFMLIPSSKGYIEELQAMADKNKVFFLPPVSTLELPQFLNQFDIGVYILPPSSFNMQYALPNKLFEFIQGRLAIAIGPSSDMSEIVKKYSNGIVAADFTPESMAKKLSSLNVEQIMAFKSASDNAARIECSEKNCEAFLSLIENSPT